MSYIRSIISNTANVKQQDSSLSKVKPEERRRHSC